MVALGAWAFAGEAMSWQGWLGVIIVSLAIMSLAAPGRLRHERELSSIGFALATGVTIALYSLADGMGVRRAGNDFSYILWLLAIERLPLLLVSLWLRRGRIRASFVPALRTIEKLTNGYYLISYATQKAAGERGFQKVNVAVKNADFRVRARRGYSLGD